MHHTTGEKKKKEEGEKRTSNLLGLGKRALEEESFDRMLVLLQARQELAESLFERPPEVRVNLQECLETEIAILRRLESERRKLLVEMERLAAKRKAMQRYSPRFPIPSMPVFFDSTG